MDEFRNRRISVIGAARSGVAAAGVLTHLGAETLLAETQPAEKLGAARLAEITATGARFVANASVEAALPVGTELVVTSPGVPRTAPVLQEAVRRGIPIWSEIELAYRLTDAPIVAITGTNGKTTTTLLIAAMLQAAGKPAIIAGNVSADEIKRTLVDAAYSTRWPPPPSPPPRTGEGGRERRLTSPLLVRNERQGEGAGGEVVKGDNSPILVAEISSFQLEWVERFAPKVAVLTNITPDHLNRHADFAEYAQAKARIFAAQGSDDWAVLNWDDPTAREIGLGGVPGRRCWFSRTACGPADGPLASVHAGMLQVALEDGSAPVPILPVAELPATLPGMHSIENVLAASAASLAMGADAEAIARAVRSFGGVAHRMEWVAEIEGVRYINNSMCTNIAAAICSLEALDRPAIVIAGGAAKGLDFAPLTPTLRAKAKHLLLIGEAAAQMEVVFRVGGYEAITRAASLPEAVAEAHRRAAPGDVVILSPACASFDMFADFEARGAAFRDTVRALAERSL